jgi:hypothetical protein
MITPEVISQLPVWLKDHPTIFCYADSMLAGSMIHGEAMSQILYGVQLSHSTNARSAGFIAANLQSELRSWRERWLGDERKLNIIKPVEGGIRCIVLRFMSMLIPSWYSWLQL